MLTPLRRLRFSDVDDFSGFKAYCIRPVESRVLGAAPRSVNEIQLINEN